MKLLIAAVFAALTLAIAPGAAAVEVPCPSPIVPHDDTTVYETSQGAGVYTFKIQIPAHAPGDYTSCHVIVDTPTAMAQFDFMSPSPLICHEIDVSIAVEGRGTLDRWCLSPEESSPVLRTTANFRISVEPPELFSRFFEWLPTQFVKLFGGDLIPIDRV